MPTILGHWIKELYITLKMGYLKSNAQKKKKMTLTCVGKEIA